MSDRAMVVKKKRTRFPRRAMVMLLNSALKGWIHTYVRQSGAVRCPDFALG